MSEQHEAEVIPDQDPPAAAPAALAPAAFSFLGDVEVELTVQIGRRRMAIADILRLSAGQTVELGKAAGEPIDVLVNGRLLGRGEPVVVGDRYGIRLTEIVADAQGKS